MNELAQAVHSVVAKGESVEHASSTLSELEKAAVLAWSAIASRDTEGAALGPAQPWLAAAEPQPWLAEPAQPATETA